MKFLARGLSLVFALALLCSVSTPIVSAATATTAAGPNLIANPSVETANPANPSQPQGWQTGGWGTNTATYSYLNTGHTGSHSVEVQLSSYTSGDAKWYFAPVTVKGSTQYDFSDYYEANVPSDVVVQLEDASGNLTYQDLGDAAASSSWEQYSGAFTTSASTVSATVFHLISSVGNLTTDDFSLNTPAATVVNPPKVSITSPKSKASLSGVAALTATATAVGGNPVTSVQFQVDGQNVGAPVVKAPYTYNWDSTTVPNGTHTITAIASSADGQSTTSTALSVTTANTNINLLPNPSVETADPSDPSLPLDWYQGQWGDNSATFTYNNTGHTGSHSLGITMTNFSDGGANWSSNSAPVTAGQLYAFSDYYQSNVTTQAMVAVQMSDGTTQYLWLGNPYTSDGTWTKFFATVTMPTGAVSATAYQSISGNGYLTADDFNFEAYKPQGFTKPLVSLTFDDSIASQYTAGLPILQKDGLKGTFYIISGDVGVCDPNISSICYMTQAQVQGLQTAGEEVGSHTVDHPDLTTITTPQVDSELSTSQTALEAMLGGTPVTDFAAPYGDVNLSVLTEINKYYASQRGVEAGYNSVDNYNQQDLLVQDVDSDTTVAQVESYIAYAKATNTWLILVYHDIDNDATLDPGYNTTISQFTTEMKYLKNSGVNVDTMNQAIQTVAPQIKQ